MLETWIIHDLIRVLLGRSTLEEGGNGHHNVEKKKPTRGNT
jgi:hypothetical protein